MADLVQYFQQLVPGFPSPRPCTCGGRRLRNGGDHICCPSCCARELAAESYIMMFDIHHPVLGLNDEELPTWRATLNVTAADPARLMREGFYWDQYNVIPQLSFINHNRNNVEAEAGFRYRRVWHLADRSPERLWHAGLVVYGRDTPTLAKFRVSHLEPCAVTRAKVRSPRERCDEHRGLVYHFNVQRPEFNVNAIYDDMPLEGWWPWPKNRGQ